MSETLTIILSSGLFTTITSGIVALYFNRKTERLKAEIAHEFDLRSKIQNTDFDWKKKSAEILGQVYVHLNRTRLAFDSQYSKLNAYDPFLEDEVMLASNKLIRDVILSNGQYIPPHLLEQAGKLVEHYDAWLVKYNNVRVVQKDTSTVHIYVGILDENGKKTLPFPTKAEDLFRLAYEVLFNEITHSKSAVFVN